MGTELPIQPSTLLKYQYQKIQNLNIETRLLFLEPGSPNDPLQGSIYHSVHLHGQSYEAVSYTWGNPNALASSPLLLNDRTLSITCNVETMLRELRHPHQRCVFWIDAVCIDQDDLNERALHVRIMRKIYTRATRVIVWIGESDSESREALQGLAVLSNHGSFDSDGVEASLNSHSSLEDMIQYAGTHSNVLNQIIALLDRHWFHRLWIVQEVVVSKEVAIKCGAEWLDWKSFSNALAVLVLLHSSPKSRFRGDLPLLRALKIDRHRRLENQHRSINGLVHDYRDNMATDPRDKIYALYGLANDSPHFPEPNYLDSITNIYVQFAMTVMQRHNSLFLLHAITSFELSGGSADLSLPSWVPDWRHPWSDNILFKDVLEQATIENGYQYYSVARPPRISGVESETEIPMVRHVLIDNSRIATTIQISSEWRILSIYGLCWSEVASVVPIDVENIAQSVDWFLDAYDRVNSTVTGNTILVTLGFAKQQDEMTTSLLRGRAFVRLKNGSRGLGSSCNIQEGDIVCFLHDQGVPFVLRKTGENYRLIGQFLTGSVLDGKVGSLLETSSCKVEWFSVQ
ncbi:hypothetical protein GJ744_003953 [Endocarpon pusillum]|uniref:Heterokaryon incompatibility domain-containing protein n=1 Tax=Endocarpon pusillum TaxID=364733 RepID=A0A8H7AA01_9EURO|nr:hypothetical protein GJ744_003953 [Endocarpon pusillum]